MKTLLIASIALLAVASSPNGIAAHASALNVDANGTSSSIAETFGAADPCKPWEYRNNRCVSVYRCGAGVISALTYYKSSAPWGEHITPRQATKTRICYRPATEKSPGGLVITEDAADNHAASPHTICNSDLQSDGSTMGWMIFPVGNPYDIPSYFYQLDIAPSGITSASMVYNSNGNVTNCNSCMAGSLVCLDPANFIQVRNMTHTAQYTYEGGKKVGWTTERFLPFSMFRDLSAGSMKYFRFNAYRFGYPFGHDYVPEVSAHNPTWSTSLNVPSRFGVLILID